MSRFSEAVESHISLREATQQQLGGLLLSILADDKETVSISVEINDGWHSWSDTADPDQKIGFTITVNAVTKGGWNDSTVNTPMSVVKALFNKEGIAEHLTLSSLNPHNKTIFAINSQDSRRSDFLDALAVTARLISDIIENEANNPGNYTGFVGSMQTMSNLLYDSIHNSIIATQYEEREESIGQKIMEEQEAEAAVTGIKQGHQITFKYRFRTNKSGSKTVNGRYCVTKCTRKSIILKGIDTEAYQGTGLIKIPMMDFERLMLNHADDIVLETSEQAKASQAEREKEIEQQKQDSATNEG